MSLRDLFAKFVVKVDTHEVKEAHGHLEHAKHEAEGLGHQFEHLTHLVHAFLGALAVEQIAEMTEELAKEAVQLDASAAAAGLSTEQFEGWQDVMQATGQDAGSLGFLIKVLERNSYEAANGSKELAKAFKELDISQEQLKESSPEELLNLTTEALANIDQPAKRAALAQATLGRGALALLPALSRGAEGLEHLRHELEEAGPAFTEEFIEHSKEAAIVAFKWHRSLEQLKVSIATHVLPILDKFQEFATRVAKAITAAVSNQEKLEAIMLTIATIAIPYLISAFGGLTTILKALRTVAIETFLPFLVIAAIGLAVEDLIVFLKGGDSALGAFLDTMFGADSAKITLEGINTAWDTVVTTAKDSVEWAKKAKDAFVDFFSPETVNGPKDGLDALNGSAAESHGWAYKLINAWGDFGGWFMQSLKDCGDMLGNLTFEVVQGLTGMWNSWKASAEGAINWVGDKIDALFQLPGFSLLKDYIQSHAPASAAAALASDQAGVPRQLAGFSMIPPTAPGGSSNSTSQNWVLEDKRSVVVQVNSATAANAGATGREVAHHVEGVQAEDRHATLAAVGGHH